MKQGCEMDEHRDDWPPPPDIEITAPVLPARSMQKWLSLIISVVGASCFSVLMVAAPQMTAISDDLWTNVYEGFLLCSFTGFVLGASVCRSWQGIIAMLMGLICAVILGIDIATHPFDH